MFGRRRLIELAAGSSSLAFLSSFARWSVAQAEGVDRPNVIFLITPMTFINRLSPELEQEKSQATGYKYPSILNPVLAETSRISVVSGLHNSARVQQHSSGYATLTCMPHISPPTIDQCEDERNSRPGGISIDQLIAQAFKSKTADPVLSLNFGVPAQNAYDSGNDLWFSYSASGADQKLKKEVRPDKVFARLFGSLKSSPGKPSPENLDAIASQKILDVLRGDINRVKQRIPSSERPKLDQMFESAGSLQLEMQKLSAATRAGACSVPGMAPVLGAPEEVRDNLQYKPLYRSYFDATIDNTVLALSCGLSRVATVELDPSSFPDLLLDLTQHDCSHGFTKDFTNGYPSDFKEKNAISDNWLGKSWGAEAGWKSVNETLMSYLGSLVKKLKATPAAGGKSLFDNTIIVGLSSSGHRDHWGANLQSMLLVGGHPSLPTGQFYRFGTGKEPDGEQMPLPGSRFTGDLFASVANWVGVPLAKFGDSRFAAGPISFS